MPFNGSGTFNRLYSWVNDAANGIKILATRMDAETDGIAAGLSNCITRDGQGKPTAAIDWNGQNLSGVAALGATGLATLAGGVTTTTLIATGNATLGDASGDVVEVRGTLTATPPMKVGGGGNNGRINFGRSTDSVNVGAIYWGAAPATGPFTFENVNGGDFYFISPRAEGGLLSFTYSPTTNFGSLSVYAVSNDSYSAAASAAKVGRNSSTSRSINAAGTLNASGADYAEYMAKAPGTGPNAKGAIVGVDGDGLLTDVFADAHSFVVKSTDPAYVGGDTWAAPAGHAPAEPTLTLPQFDGDPEDPDAVALHVEACAPLVAAHAVAMAQYAAGPLATWEAELEALRQAVDRIAFSGQVPVNVLGATSGQYIVATHDGAGIKGVPMWAADMDSEDWLRVVGKVWKVLPDGRAWIAVKVV